MKTVNNPPHYKSGGVEVIDVIEAFQLNFRLANAIKYILRAGKKDPKKNIEDLKKAVWYIEREILKTHTYDEQRDSRPTEREVLAEAEKKWPTGVFESRNENSVHVRPERGDRPRRGFSGKSRYILRGDKNDTQPKPFLGDGILRRVRSFISQVLKKIQNENN